MCGEECREKQSSTLLRLYQFGKPQKGTQVVLPPVRQCFAVCSSLDKSNCISEIAVASPFARSAVI